MTGVDLGALVATKLQAPTAPRHLVRRARLDRLLDRAIEERHRLVLVSAPAGSGKSTLLAGCLGDRDLDLAWLQVEDSDADPARFWSYLAAAIDGVRHGVTDAVGPIIVSSGGSPDAVVTALVNVLAEAPDPLVVAIDDYHVIDNPAVHAGVERLVELCPDHVRIVIATRADPAFRLGRLRVSGQLTEIRAADLRFDADEAADLLDSPLLDRQMLDELCNRTEGWAAGLVLAGLSLAGTDDATNFISGFRGDDQLVVDYLTDELLASITPDDRRRLLESSILERLTGPLIDAVTGSTDGTAWLTRIAASNQMVVGLDRTGTSYRYHHLLRDLLRLEAEREIADRLPDLHLAAAAWHHEHGDMYTAIEHYISGGDLVTAGDLIAIHATALLNGGQIFTVLRLLDRLGDLPERHARSALVRGWINLSTGRFAGARHYYDVAAEFDDGTDANLTASLGIMVHLAEGDLGEALSIAGRMTEPTESTQAIGLAAAHTWAGKFDAARRHIAIARELAAAEPSDYAASVAPGLAAVVEFESGNLAAAAEHAMSSLDHAHGHGLAESPQLSVSHAILARTTSDPERRTAAAERAIELARRAPEPFTFGYAHAIVGDTACEHDDPAGPDLLRVARGAVDRSTEAGIVGATLARIEARHGLAERAPAPPGLVDQITDRELAVLRYLPSQMSQREIAGELYVSLNTVKTHCKAIYRKLGVDGRKSAVHAARELGLL
ncbi:MAG: LuxR C-terminal-related transcriptional regulator [Ilumatobacteraceae bacterium]|nr:LuxR C-terminal-related transcriptional regulator [Ilumatobacteraceae bacterium]